MSDFLQVSGKAFLIFGVANRKSVAWHVGQTLKAAGADVVYVVRSEERKTQLTPLLAGSDVFVCDVEFEDQIQRVRDQIAATGKKFHGLLHSIAFADYSGGLKPFHETGKPQFLRTVDISCYSFIALANAFKELLDPEASVVTVSISTTRM